MKVILSILLAGVFCSAVHAQTSEFTYQGRLVDNGVPANGTYQFQVAVQDAATNTVAGPAFPVLGVTNGLFTVALDFGYQVFDGSVRYIQIGVRTNGSVAPYTILAPRQEITSAPYAVQAQNSVTANYYLGNISDSQLSANIPRLVSGKLPDAELSNNVARLNVSQTFTGSNNFSGGVNIADGTGPTGQAGTLHVGGYAASNDPKLIKFGDGSFVTIGENIADDTLELHGSTFAFTSGGNGFVGIGITNPSSKLHVAGTVTANAFSGDGSGLTGIPQLASNQIFTGTNTFSTDLNVNGTINATAFTGNGSGLIGVAKLASNQTFTGSNVFSGGVNIADGTGALSQGGTLHVGGYGANADPKLIKFGDGSYVSIGENIADDTMELHAATFALTSDGNGFVGVGITNPSSKLHVVGTVTATAFVGSGTGLTGIPQLGSNQTYTGTVTFNPAAGAPFAVNSTTKVTNLNSDLLDGLDSSSFWQLGGNSGTIPGTHFLGTKDNQALEMKVNNTRALRLEPNTNGAPNVIGGSPRNYVGSGKVGATIAGGGVANLSGSSYTNFVLDDFGTVSGGLANHVDGYCGAIVGGFNNVVTTNSTYNFIGGGWGNFIHHADVSTIAGGTGNAIDAANDVVSRGSYASAIGGGYVNQILQSWQATIAGGRLNTISSNADMATIGGGYSNSIAVDSGYSTIAGGVMNAVDTNSVYNVISGGTNNSIAGGVTSSVIGGGYWNSVSTNSNFGTIGGGKYNSIADSTDSSWIGGGWANSIGSFNYGSSVAGGSGNTIGSSGDYNTISGGEINSIAGGVSDATISGGIQNVISAGSTYSAIGGGRGNVISSGAPYAVICGGQDNTAAGEYAFAAGHRAKANHYGAFVWADGVDADIASTNGYSMTIRASGGTRLFSNSASTVGVYLAAGSGTWASMSDRNMKENFSKVNSQEVLNKVAALPISTWNYKTQPKETRHIGPMAQDFAAAFAVGENDRTITSVDEGGVALAAIQGLNQKLEAQSKEKDAEIAELKKTVAQLQAAVAQVLKQQK